MNSSTASLDRKQWGVLVAADLGWLVDGFEIFALFLTVGFALRQLLDAAHPPICWFRTRDHRLRLGHGSSRLDEPRHVLSQAGYCGRMSSGACRTTVRRPRL
jgi:hypothetical protein